MTPPLKTMMENEIYQLVFSLFADLRSSGKIGYLRSPHKGGPGIDGKNGLMFQATTYLEAFILAHRSLISPPIDADQNRMFCALVLMNHLTRQESTLVGQTPDRQAKLHIGEKIYHGETFVDVLLQAYEADQEHTPDTELAAAYLKQYPPSFEVTPGPPAEGDPNQGPEPPKKSTRKKGTLWQMRT